MAILLALLLAQDGSLVDRLGDDDLDVRDAAHEALGRQGSAAVPLLREGLKHASPEVRARTSDLLQMLPEFRGRRLRRHPEFARAARIWNATIESVIHRKPIPAALWKEIGDPTIHHEQPLICSADPVVPHPEAWILARLADGGAADLRWLAQKYGVVGLSEDVLVPRQEGPQKKGRRDLLPRLAALRPDWETLEEVYGSLLILRLEGLGAWTDLMADEDWDTVLLFLMTIRLRPDAKPAKPLGGKESIQQIRRGPWIRGLARGLGRAFANPGQTYARSDCTVPRIPWNMPESEWQGTAVHYQMLLEMERDISRCWFWKDRLRTAPAAVPKKHPDLDRLKKKTWFLPVREALDGPGLNVAATLLTEVKPLGWLGQHRAFLTEISRQVSAAAFKESR